MGNNSSKDGSSGPRNLMRRQQESHDGPVSAALTTTTPSQSATQERDLLSVYGQAGSSSRRGSRHDLSFLHLQRDRPVEQQQTKPRETRQEREARRAERERQARLKERERSVKEESVDGGFLVTLGTYTGPEDFSKSIVRQLQIERRLAPFWKGLQDHSDSWTEHQLVAVVRGLPLPAADDASTEIPRSPSQVDAPWQVDDPTRQQSTPSISLSIEVSKSATQLSTSQPVSTSSPLAPVGSSPLFRTRSKTLATLTGGSRITAPDLTLNQETRLPKDPYINGLPIEAYLYREPGECPICFLYYPPYLNKTRCCDQAICSECFVQIKRPDPHPPEHEQPGQMRSPEEEAGLLISEVASCPFCKAAEFGITYEPPPFRRGIINSNQNLLKPGRDTLSATSSQSSIQSGERRRTISISAAAPEVVTTDKVRPDWAKKLADARAHVLRRSAAATALHNAAYVLGSEEIIARNGYGRRRRSIFGDVGGSNSSPRDGGEGSDLAPGRGSSRRARVEDLEDLMMMEAIRLSIAAEEDRKRKQDKEKIKQDKKKAKEAKRDAKQLDKLSKKGNGSSSSIYKLHANDSASTWATSSMARSASNLGSTPAILEQVISGKGKSPAVEQHAPASTSEPSLPANESQTESQRHLVESRANLSSSGSNPIAMPSRRHHLRQLSDASSFASSFVDSPTGSYRAESPMPSGGFDALNNGDANESPTPPTVGNTGGLEPFLNFQSLAAMIDKESEKPGSDHLGGLLMPEHPPTMSKEESIVDAPTAATPATATTEKLNEKT